MATPLIIKQAALKLSAYRWIPLIIYAIAWRE